MSVLASCKPEKVFGYFEWLSSVPHGSGNTLAVSNLCVRFAKEHGLAYVQDSWNNIVIYKPATPGYESSPVVILQGHLDMVCAKDPDDPRDMSREPITLKTDGEWVWADGTSLGGDDMIAVSCALAVLDDDTLPHPPLEALFTVDEETGMYGAEGLDASLLRGRRMINLDSEEEGVFTVACAGGLRADISYPVHRESVPDNTEYYTVAVEGLLGGHSGCEITKERGNANKLLARMLYEGTNRFPLRLCSVEGGTFDNVITPKAAAVIAVEGKDAAELLRLAEEYRAIYKSEYALSDPGISVTVTKADTSASLPVAAEDTRRVLQGLFVLPYGVQSMSLVFPGLPETSLNLGILRTTENAVTAALTLRSSVETKKEALLQQVSAVAEMSGGQIAVSSRYPAWEYRPDSVLRTVLARAYRSLNGKDAALAATHGGLECGILASKLPGLDCVSLGPDLRDIHSPKERLSVGSVERMYRLLCETLKELKD